MEAGAALGLALGTDFAAMAADDSPHRSKADARARKFAGAVEALERAEQAIGKPHVEAGAVVAHREARRLAGVANEGDPRRVRVAGVLPGIAEQVLEHHAQQGRVADRDQAGLDLDLDPALRREPAQVFDDVAGEQRQIDRHAGDRLRRELREREQGVDHVVHARGGAEHALEVIDADPAEHRRIVFLDDPREALDDADRRAQVVRDQRAEGLGVAFALQLGNPLARMAQGRAQRALAAQQEGCRDGGADGGDGEQRQDDRDAGPGPDHRGATAAPRRIGSGAVKAGQAAAMRDIDNDCRQGLRSLRFKSSRFAPKIRGAAGAAQPRRPAVPPPAMHPNIESFTL